MNPEEIERHFSPGDRILDAGSRVRELYVIRSGKVRLTSGSEEEGALLGPGDLFGELAAILGMPVPYDAMAEGETSVLALDVPNLNRLCRENTEFSFRLIRHLASEMAGVPREASESDSPAARSRKGGDLEAFASVILDRSRSGEPPAIVDGKLQDLATGANLTMTEAYNALHEFLDRHWVCLVDDQLSLLEREELEALRNGS
jgi:CRP/FNR family transcriptional regulator